MAATARVYTSKRIDCGEQGRLTRAQIAEVAGINPATVSRRIRTGADLLAPRASPTQPKSAPFFFEKIPLVGEWTRLETAFRIAFRYGMKLPTVLQLQRDFGMSRPTAYRWLRAMRDAKGEP